MLQTFPTRYDGKPMFMKKFNYDADEAANTVYSACETKIEFVRSRCGLTLFLSNPNPKLNLFLKPPQSRPQPLPSLFVFLLQATSTQYASFCRLFLLALTRNATKKWQKGGRKWTWNKWTNRSRRLGCYGSRSQAQNEQLNLLRTPRRSSKLDKKNASAPVTTRDATTVAVAVNTADKTSTISLSYTVLVLHWAWLGKKT